MFIIAPFLVLTELGCAYQTVVSPVLFEIVIVGVEIAGLIMLSDCCNDCIAIRDMGKFRNRAFVVTAFCVLVGFAFYFDRPMLWDTFQGMIIGGLASTLMEFGVVMSLRWTAKGTRVAAGIIAYRRKLEVEGPQNEDDESEVWRYLAYSSALMADECLVLRMRPWFHWARSPVLDPDRPISSYDGDGGSGWGGGGGDFGGGAGFGGGGGGGGAW
jgi:uncharacterized membrane protein YgcG